MANRTQIVCLCEGEKGRSIDEVFINKLMKALKPAWLRPQGSNAVRLNPCGGRKAVVERMPQELRNCLNAGADTTLMVWADCDDNCTDGNALKAEFWRAAAQQGISQQEFDRVVFIFAKDRLENWIQFLQTGATDEAVEGPRVKTGKEAADAAKMLADFCKAKRPLEGIPPSLRWSCKNWQDLVNRMKSS